MGLELAVVLCTFILFFGAYVLEFLANFVCMTIYVKRYMAWKTYSCEEVKKIAKKQYMVKWLKMHPHSALHELYLRNVI